jgi:hypothetical protein
MPSALRRVGCRPADGFGEGQKDESARGAHQQEMLGSSLHETRRDASGASGLQKRSGDGVSFLVQRGWLEGWDNGRAIRCTTLIDAFVSRLGHACQDCEGH